MAHVDLAGGANVADVVELTAGLIDEGTDLLRICKASSVSSFRSRSSRLAAGTSARMSALTAVVMV
jgi:hypothetical protein